MGVPLGWWGVFFNVSIKNVSYKIHHKDGRNSENQTLVYLRMIRPWIESHHFLKKNFVQLLNVKAERITSTFVWFVCLLDHSLS